MDNWTFKACIHEIMNLIIREDAGVNRTALYALRNTPYFLPKTQYAACAEVNYQDPVLLKLFDMIGFQPLTDDGALPSQLIAAFTWWFDSKFKSADFSDPNFDEALQVINLYRSEGGAEAVDKVFEHIIPKPLSELITFVESNFIAPRDDSGVSCSDCYMLGFTGRSLGKITYAQHCYAVSSSAQDLLRTIPRCLQRIGREFDPKKPDHTTPIMMVIERSGKLVAKVKIEPSVASISRGGSVEKVWDRTRPILNWSATEWGTSDREFFMAVLPLIPKDQSFQFKGKFMEDELGI